MLKKLSLLGFIFLLLALFSRANAMKALIGTPGHAIVEALADNGQWMEVGQLSFNLTPSKQKLDFPAALFGKSTELKLRITQPDNDESQYDYIALEADGVLMKPRALLHQETNESLIKKLAKVDHDVAEMHGQTLIGQWPKSARARSLTLTLMGRSSKTSDLPFSPFTLYDQKKSQQTKSFVPYTFSAKPGSTLNFKTEKLDTNSGHPSAPIAVNMVIEKDRLKGHLDFGPDNDPGDDDFASILAFGDKGEVRKFKVTPLDSHWGQAQWAYSPLVPWQHMRFDFNIPLNELPQRGDGKVAIAFLAYGTCGYSITNGTGSLDCYNGEEDCWTGSNWYANVASSSTPTSFSVPVGTPLWFYINTKMVTGTTTFPTGTPINVTMILKMYNASNTLVYTSTITDSFTAPSPGGTIWLPCDGFTYTPSCSGTFKIKGSASIAGDTNTADDMGIPYQPELDMTVTGGSPCYTDTPTPIPAPKIIMAPVPVKAGQPVCMYFNNTPSSAKWTVYNTAGEVVAVLNFSGPAKQCWDTGAAKLAPGLYWIEIKVVNADSSMYTEWKRIAIQP